MESSILYLLLLVASLASCCASFHEETLRGNISHLQNNREPNAGAALFPTIPFIPVIHIVIVYGLNSIQENLGWYVIIIYFLFQIIYMIYVILKLKTEYNELKAAITHSVIDLNQELLRVIKLYQSAVEELFPRLAKHLGTNLPITNTDWAAQSYEQRGTTSCGIKYFIHGYGVCLKDQNMEVDFDLGAEGQINGIDPYKLWRFLEDSNIETSFGSSAEIEVTIKKEVEKGSMVFSGYLLYYLS